MRRLLALALLALAARAESFDALDAAARWSELGPHDRRHLGERLADWYAAHRFSDARVVLIEIDGRLVTPADLFSRVLDPALTTPTVSESPNDPGLQEVHRAGLHALQALRAAYAPPRPVTTGTLNLFLDYAQRALHARELGASTRLRFFTEAARAVRDLDGRVTPDAYTRWILHERLLPPLLAHARNGDAGQRAAIVAAAQLLFAPSLLDPDAEALLAPLTGDALLPEMLERHYRRGALDGTGLVAYAENVGAHMRADPAFAAGSPPLVLELLCDEALPASHRAHLADVVLAELAPLDALRPAAVDLLAAAFGGPPRTLDAYREARNERKAGLPMPEAGRAFRFLRVVLVQEDPTRPPRVARVEREDVPYYRPLRGGDDRRFLGTLVPDATGRHAALLGPPPALAAAGDNRLLRRPLELERIAIETYGVRREILEVCATLPDDASEPVPGTGASVADVVTLIDRRLKVSTDAAERAELIPLLVGFRTGAASDAAVRHATTPAAARALIPLMERGHAGAATRLLETIATLDWIERERVLASAVLQGPEVAARVAQLCRDEDPATAALAADALLSAGDPAGVLVLFEHRNIYARVCAGSLALRLSPAAGGLRVVPRDGVELAPLRAAAAKAFADEPKPWSNLAEWLALALQDEVGEARRARQQRGPYFVGKREVTASEFARAYAKGFREGKAQNLRAGMIAHVLQPSHPGISIQARDLAPLLDVLEEQALADPKLRAIWRDALVALAAAQWGIEMDAEWLDFAHRRLALLAGDAAPREARRKAGVFWPLWAADDAAREDGR